MINGVRTVSISKGLFKGAIWNAVSQFGTQGINFVVIIILARLLGPKDFGLVGMVSVITSFLGYFTECGLLPSLIQKREADELDCNTVFWCTVFFSVTLYVSVYLAAPVIGLFYGDDRLVVITRVLFLNFLVAPLGFIPEVLEVKKLKYDKITLADLSGAFLSGVVGIGMAISGYGVWSLVWQQISLVLFRGIVLALTVGWYPRFYFSYVRLKQLFNFGAHYTIRNIMFYLSENIDYLLVGKLLGPTALGIYTLAFRMSKYLFLKLWGVFGKMLFPAFNSFKDDLPRVRRNYLKVSVLGGFVLIPLFIWFFFSLDSLVPIVMGKQWLQTVPVVRVFILYLLFASISYADDALMIALGQIKTLNAMKLLSALGLLVFGYIMIQRMGIIGMAMAYTVVAVSNAYAVQRSLFQRLSFSYLFYVRNFKLLFLLSVTLLIALGICAYFLGGRVSSFVFLLNECAIFISIFMLFLWKAKLIDFKKRRICMDKIVHFE